LNEHGTIALPRLQMMLDRLAEFEVERFEEEFADQNWYKGKQTKQIDAMEKARKRGKLSKLCSARAADDSHHQGSKEDIRGRQGVLAQTPVQAITQ
jgi:5'-3' exonuclease